MAQAPLKQSCCLSNRFAPSFNQNLRYGRTGDTVSYPFQTLTQETTQSSSTLLPQSTSTNQRYHINQTIAIKAKQASHIIYCNIPSIMSNPNPIQQEENAVKTLSSMKSTPGSRPSKTWTAEEDDLVTKQMLSHANLPQEEQEKFTQWAGIAALLPGRTGRQVRDRWSNHLNPIIIHEPFTTEDDIKLWNAATTVGKKWVEISSTIFKGTRSENQCKNRWNSAAFKVWVARTYGNQGTSYFNPNALSQTYKRTLEDQGSLELAPSPVKQVKSRKKKAKKNYQAMQLHNPDTQREAYSNCVAGYLESKGTAANPSNSKKPKAGKCLLFYALYFIY